jgi:hypothetical protein
MPTQEHADNLRRRIELYRSYLREGVDVSLAREYLREIAEGEAELARLTGTGSDRIGAVRCVCRATPRTFLRCALVEPSCGKLCYDLGV